MLERFIARPSTKLYGGIEVDKDTIHTDKTDDGAVEQEIKDLVLTTKIDRTTDLEGTIITEKSLITMTLQDGDLLIWNEDNGFGIAPDNAFTRIPDAKNVFELVEDITKKKGE